jgi:hypothetical protein
MAHGLPDSDSAPFNMKWAAAYEATFSLGTPLPRFLPQLMNGLGGYDMFFYGHFPFLVEALLAPACIGCDTAAKLALTGAVLLLISSATCYLFLREFFAPWPALVGAMIYSVLPYHLWIDWFWRQAIGEFAASIFIPLIALGTYRLLNGRNSGLLLAIGVAGCTFTHLPTALLGAHVYGILVIVYLFGIGRHDPNRLGTFLRIAGWATLGLALAAFYWLPALDLLETVSPKALYSPAQIAESWLYGLSFDQPVPSLAKAFLILFAALLPIAVLGSIVADRPLRFWILVPLIIVVIANHQISAPLWNHWIIERIQFPYRLQVFSDLSFAISAASLTAYAIAYVKPRRATVIAFVLIYPSALFLWQIGIPETFPENIAEHEKQLTPPEYLSPEMAQVLIDKFGTEFVYAPGLRGLKEAIEIVSVEHPTPKELLVGQGRQWQITPPEGDVLFAVPLQFWQFWTAHDADGNMLTTHVNPDHGTLDVIAIDGGFDGSPITLNLPVQPSEKLGYLISLVAFFGLFTAVGLRKKIPALQA